MTRASILLRGMEGAMISHQSWTALPAPTADQPSSSAYVDGSLHRKQVVSKSDSGIKP